MKRKLLSVAAVAGFALLAFSLVSVAQPVTPGGGLSRVTTSGGGLEGSGTVTNPLKLRTDCGNGSGLAWSSGSASWSCAAMGGGGVADGDKGDVTVSGGGATWTIDSNAVTYGQIQQVAPDRVLGRISSIGDVEEIVMTAAGRALVDDASAAAQRATLGLGALATQGDGDKGDITVASSGASWTIDTGVVGTTQLADNLDLSANGNTKVGDFRGAWIAPASVSGTLNDWNPTGLVSARNIHVTSSADTTITGIQGGVDGRELTICNASTNRLLFTNEAGGSTAANRVRMTGGATWILYGTAYWASNGIECISLTYNGTASRWFMTDIASSNMTQLEVTGNTFLNATTVSGLVTVNNRAIVNGASGSTSLAVNGVSTGGNVLDVQQASTGMAASSTSVRGVQSGSMNATATTRASYGVQGVANTTRSAGSNDVTNYGVYGSASGGQINYAGYFDTGDFNVNGIADFNSTLNANANAKIGANTSNTLALNARINTHVTTTGTTPSVSCGAGATIVGNDTAGVVTQGTSPSVCTVTFAVPFTTNAPVCVVSGDSSANRTVSIAGATTSSVSFSYVTPTDDLKQKFYYHCLGRL